MRARNLAVIRFSFAPAGITFLGLRVRKRRRTERGEVLRLIQIRLAMYSFENSRQLVKNIRRKRKSPIRVQEMQPQLQPALLSLSAMISQYFIAVFIHQFLRYKAQP
jgi:hypothetical protein